MPAIESKDFTLGEIFRDFYAVPDYQREFVWEEEEVDQLLTDIRREQADDNDAEYFIGSIVTCLNAGGRYELIDGQQRMTTIFLAFCALRDRLRDLGESSVSTIQNLIATERVDANGEESREPRIELQYEDAGNLVQELVDERKFTGKGSTGQLSTCETRTVVFLISLARLGLRCINGL